MPIIETEVKTYSLEYLCDDCGKGYLIYKDLTFLTMPPQYKHICSNCGKQYILTESFPRTETKKEENK